MLDCFPGGIHWVSVGKQDKAGLLMKLQNLCMRLDQDFTFLQRPPLNIEEAKDRLRWLMLRKYPRCCLGSRAVFSVFHFTSTWLRLCCFPCPFLQALACSMPNKCANPFFFQFQNKNDVEGVQSRDQLLLRTAFAKPFSKVCSAHLWSFWQLNCFIKHMHTAWVVI